MTTFEPAPRLHHRLVGEPTQLACARLVAGLEPWYTHLGGAGLAPRGCELADPGVSPLVAVELRTREFDRHCRWRYLTYRSERGRELRSETLWVGGMMAWVVDRVYLVSDDAERVYGFYHVMNDPEFLVPLCELVPDHVFTRELLAHLSRWVGRS